VEAQVTAKVPTGVMVPVPVETQVTVPEGTVQACRIFEEAERRQACQIYRRYRDDRLSNL
jgi:hypothetical protein